MQKIKYSLGLFIATLSLNAFANTQSINLALGSALYYDNGNERPFVLKGNELMSEWQFSDNFIGLPSDIKWFISETISCADKTCFSAGGYNTFTNPHKVNAIVMRSDDSGFSWFLHDVTPSNSDMADLKNISCDNGKCVAIGFYDSNNHKKQPLILTSDDNFQSWQQITDIANFDSNSSLDSLKSNCTKEYCVIAGSLYDMNHDAEKPIFFFTDKEKKKWSVAKILQDASYIKSIKFKKISCSEKTCAAVGYSSENFRDAHPLLYVSLDKGLTWSNKIISDKFSRLESVKCKGDFCVAVGINDSQGFQDKGMVIVSHDKGNTWQIKNLETPKNDYFYITDSDCTDNFCVIGGNYYYPSQPNQFFMYVSHDEGNTWSQIKNINNMPKIDNVNTTGLTCNEENCLYTIEDGNFSVRHTPIVITSDKSGEKWQVISNFLNIPDNINAMLVDTNYHGQQAINAMTNEQNRFKLTTFNRNEHYRAFN